VTPGSSNNTTPVLPPPPAEYVFKPTTEHFFMFVFQKMESKAMGVKAALGDFNTFNFSSQQLTVSMGMLKLDQGYIVVKSFPTAAHAKIYMNAVRSNNLLLKEYKSDEYTLMIISGDNFKKLQADKDMEPYRKFYKANYK